MDGAVTEPDATQATPRPLNLALQGGGSHGAFTWGVLDRLLEDERFSFAAISGTSAGAMNAAALADGWVRGGRAGARERLAAFWTAVGEKGRFSPVQRTPYDVLTGNWALTPNPALFWFNAFMRSLAPRDANPFGYNPLRDVVDAEIDFANVRACHAVNLFITATHVQTGKGRVFTQAELTAEHLMASACLPTVFETVEIDEEPYWDGGFAGNPSLYPFFYHNTVSDLLLVQINPITRREAPRSARDIEDRMNEITFNAGLLAELRAIAFVKKLIGQGRISADEYRDIRLHRIDADDALADLSAGSKMLSEPGFLIYLRDLGRAAAEDWLEDDAHHVGVRSGVDLSGMLARDARDALLAKVPRSGRHVRDMMQQRPLPRDAGRV
jgi:NTE family protein